jgi:hypothetical protein
MKKVKVGKSKIHGNGLFADEPIKRGDVIELVHTMRELEPGVIKTTPTLLGRNYNHSDDSNALNVVDGNNRYLVALKEIEAGGEITTDYRTNPDLEQPDSFTSNNNYISFDYDDTLTTPEGFKLAQQMNKEGKNLYVITARDKVTPQMIERAEAAGIPKENIIPAGSDEAKVRIIKENNINKHIDNKDSVIKALGDKGELFVPDAYPDLKADFVEMDLSDDDLNKLKEGGFVIEEYANGGEPDPKTNFYTVQGSDGVYRKVNGKWEVDWNRSGKFQPLSKGDVAKRTAVLNSQAKPLYDQAYDDLYTTQRQPFTSKPVNKPTPAKSTGKIESFDNSLYTADETTDYKPINYVDKNDPSKLYIIYGDNVIQPGRPGGSYIKDKDEKKKIKNNARLATQFDLDRLPANQIYSSPEELEYIRRAASGEDPYVVNAELKNKETANKDQAYFNNNFQLKDVDPNKWDPMRLETAKEMSDKSIDFLQQWQQSPMYYEMLRNSAGEDFEYHKRGRDLRFLDGNLDPRFVNRDDPTAIGRSFGDGKIEFYPQTSFTDLDVIPHEYSHATDNNGRYIPKKDIELLKSYTTDPKKTRLYTQGYATDSDLNDKYEYLTMPTETRARINALRFAAKQSGVYDPFTQKVDPDTFKRFENIDTWYNDDGIRENTPLKDLKKAYTDEQIIEMLNTISKNNESNQEFNFAQNGGQQGDRFKKRLLKRYPGMQGVYGAEGENLNIVKDPNYNASEYGYGNIEFIHPGSGLVTYSDDYQYQSPTPNKYTAVYNPRGANRGDVFLDMMHGMRDDPNYQPLLQNFEKAVRDARGGDMAWYYEDDVKNDGYTDGQEQWDENYVDSQLRAQLAPGSIGMFSKGRRDYRKDRKYDSPEMRAAAKDIRNYLKDEYADGGERKKRKKDSKGRYRSEDGNIRTPITPEMQAEMSPDEWGQYVQEVPEVYTTRTREQQEAMKAAKQMEFLSRLRPKGPSYLYLPDGSLRPQAAEAADWVWQLGLGAKPALEGLNALAAAKIPYTGISLGTAANVVGGIHGATQVPQRIEDWQDVAAGEKDWKEAAAESLMTGLELYGGYGAAKELLPQTYNINPWALKENPEMFLYRTQPKNFKAGITEEEEIKSLITDKIIKGEKVPFWLHGKLLKIQNDPEPFRTALNKYHGQWFDKDPQRMDWYMKGRLDDVEGDILRLKLPRQEGLSYNLKNFPEAQKASLNYDTEFIVPKERLFEAEKFSTNDLQQLIQEDKTFNKPHWLRGYKEVPKELPGSPNSTIMKSGMPNPLELADAIAPNLDPFQVTTANSLLEFSPLNIIPIGKQLGTKGNAYRKFGNTMKYVQESKSLSPKGGMLPRMGKQQSVAEGNWAALNEPWEKYSGTFAAEFDFKAPGSNLGYSNPSSRAGVLITDASGKTLPEIPLTDSGLSFHRRLPFSNRYVPIDKQKLIDNKFQMATQGSHLQSLAEKYGYGLVYAGLLGVMGKDNAVKTYNKYTIDPVINEAKKIINNINTEIVPKKEYADGGLVEVRGYEGNKFRKNTNGKWEYESGRPVEDQLLIQKLTYESKPVGSPVIQGAPKPVMNQTIWENAAGTSQKNAIAREKQLQALKASPVLADQEKAEQIEWERSRAAAAQQAAQDAKWRNEQPLDMMDWLWGAAVVGPTVAPAAWAAAETAGTAAMPYINAAFNTIPGQLATSGFAADAIVNRLYPSAGKIQEGKYGEAATDIATGLLDLYGANMLSPIYKGAKATVSELGKGLYEAGNAGVDLAKTNPQAWFKTPEQILETPGLYSSAMGRTSWKDPVGKLNKFVDDVKIKSSLKRENALLDKYPGFENRNIRIPLQQEEQLKQLQIRKAIEERNLRRSKLPIKQVLTEQGTRLGGGQGRIFVNTLNPEEVIKIGTFPGGSEELANLVQAGKNLEGMPLMENVAFPTKAFTLKRPKVKGNTIIRSNSDAVQFMPWKGNPLDVNNPINKPLGFGVPSDKAKRELQYMAELLDENKVGIDYFGQNNIIYDPKSDSYKLVDLNYVDDPKKAWEWNNLDKPVKQRIEDKFGYEIPKEVPKELPGSPNTFKSSLGSMDMSKYEIKNPDYFTQLLNTYDSRRLSNSNKQFYKDLIANVKKQNGIATERQYNELQRLRTGNFNFGKKGYSNGGPINLFENQRPNSKLNKFIR